MICRVPSVRVTVVAFLLPLVIVVVSVVAAHRLLLPSREPDQRSRRTIDVMASWDGAFYIRIATDGYEYSPGRQSSVVYFPAYPVLGRGIMMLTGWSAATSLVILANLLLLGAMLAFRSYLAVRARSDCGTEEHASAYSLLLLGLLPCTFFFIWHIPSL